MKPRSSQDNMNFLHYGSALQHAKVIQGAGTPLVDKRSLVRTLEMVHPKSDLGVVVGGYGAKRQRKISVADLQTDLSNSQFLQTFFRKLTCRGFSHRVERGVRFNEPLRRAVNLRIALMSDDSFFYPPLVKKHLRRVENNHYFSGGFPSIAFALGERRQDGWYVYVLQSDLVRTKSPFVREHFRGWRKVLFAHILCEAVEETRNVFLCLADEVLKACRPEFPCPNEVPKSWKVIYDNTAKFFGMELIHVCKAINIQIYPNLPAVRTNRFYRFAVTDQSREMVRSLVGGMI